MVNSGFVFEQHPVPQQISSYQFRLIGDMTIKQFFELAGGALVSVLFYASPLPGIIKWPVVVFSVLLGAALAFLPIAERPLEKWIVVFLKSIYSPTLYLWKKTDPKSYYALSERSVQEATKSGTEKVKGSALTPKFLHNLEETEEAVLKKISGLFIKSQAPTSQTSGPVAGAQPSATMPPFVEKQYTSVPKTAPEQISRAVDQSGVSPVPRQVAIPPTIPQKTQKQGFSMPSGTSNAPIPHVIGQTLMPQKTVAPGIKAHFFAGAAPPIPPESPNIIVGQVLNNEGKIVEGAILEIKDYQGRPVRALKSARTGHFRIVTPLPNGTYRILIEKEGLLFEPVEIKATGQIIQPIVIRAKSAVDENKN